MPEKPRSDSFSLTIPRPDRLSHKEKLMRSIVFFNLVFTVFLLLHADISEARAGGGRSFGSRGSRSYQSSPSGAQPLQRSAAPQSTPSQGQNNASPAFGNPVRSNPFLTGIAGGVVGAELGHLLFGGGGGYGGGYGGGGGGILPLLLLGLVAFFVIRYFRRRNVMGANAGEQGSSFMPLNFAPSSSTPYASMPDPTQPIQVSESDIAAFKQLFLDIQKAWSEQNMNRLRMAMTPEMVQYFNDELSANISRGVSNQIYHITIRDVQTVEAWSEDNLHYASMRMQWDACDYDIRLDRQPADADYIASGDAQRPDTTQEQWTFSRVDNGRWLLSAIQQL